MSPTPARSTLGKGTALAVPPVTFLLIALCVCLHAFSQFTARQLREQVEQELQQAVDYVNDHPYLEPGPMLAERIDAAVLREKRRSEQAARDRRGAPPLPARITQRHQLELERLVMRARSGLSQLPDQRFGFRATARDPLTLLTFQFIHAGFAHLVGTLFLLLVLGFYLENAWGSGIFLLAVILASASSAAVFAAGNSDFDAPLIGMSPLVSALTAAFAIALRRLWKQPVYSFLIVGAALFLFAPVRWGYEWSIAAGLEPNLLLADHQGASFWALGGGMAFGLIAGLVSFVFATEGEAESGAGSAKTAKRANAPALEKALQAQLAGRPAESFVTLADHLRSDPDDHEALLVMWDVALELGRPADAATAMLRAIRDEVKRNDGDAAVEHWLDLANRGLNTDAEPALLIRLALLLQQQEHTFAAVAALQQALDKAGGANAAVIASRVARASRDLDAETARAAAWRALGSVDLDIEERQGLEEMLAEIGSGIDMTLDASAPRAAPAIESVAVEQLPRRPSAAASEPEAWVDPSLGDESAEAASAPASDADPFVLGDIVDYGHSDAATDGAYAQSAPIDLDLAVRELRSVEALPAELERDGLLIEVAGGAKKRVPFEKLEAVSVAAVGGISDKPVILVDLVMNWTSDRRDPLKVIRMRADRFDARSVVREVREPLDALRALVRELLHHSGAQPLPDAASATGMPFASFDDLTVYQRSVLGAE